MLEVKLTIEAPGLATALEKLAEALHSNQGSTTSIRAPFADSSPAHSAPTHAPVPTTAAPATAPGPSPAPAPFVGQTAVPGNAQVPPAAVVPVSAAPAYTLEQLSKAGADLISSNAAKMPELLGLLQKYGVQAITQLKSEHLGAFATELREMGASI